MKENKSEGAQVMKIGVGLAHKTA